jgi:hypothetical protein
MTEYDFSKLMLPITTGSKDILTKYSHLKNYPEFRAKFPLDVDVDKVIIFTVLVNDSNGLFLYFDDILKRRYEAAILAEFPKAIKGFQEKYQDIFLWKNEKANLMAIRYCRMQRNPDFTVMIKYEEQLYRELQEMDTMPDADDRKRILDMTSTLRKNIQDLRTSFFLGDNSQTMFFELLDSLDDENLDDYRPEGIAMKRKLKQKLLNYNPYDEPS